jgi:hypothetical protein
MITCEDLNLLNTNTGDYYQRDAIIMPNEKLVILGQINFMCYICHNNYDDITIYHIKHNSICANCFNIYNELIDSTDEFCVISLKYIKFVRYKNNVQLYFIINHYEILCSKIHIKAREKNNDEITEILVRTLVNKYIIIREFVVVDVALFIVYNIINSRA